MKNFFKTISLILLLSLVWGAFAQGDFSIENKLETDTFIFGDYDENHRFPGIKETLTADYSSDKVDAKLEMSFDFFAYNQLDADYNKKLIIGVDDFTFTESYFKLRPIEKLQISFNSRDYVSGAYFPVMDRYMGVGKDFDSWDSGNYTGDIGFLFKPMDNLSLGAGINLLSYIVNKYDDTEENSAENALITEHPVIEACRHESPEEVESVHRRQGYEVEQSQHHVDADKIHQQSEYRLLYLSALNIVPIIRAEEQTRGYDKYKTADKGCDKV